MYVAILCFAEKNAKFTAMDASWEIMNMLQLDTTTIYTYVFSYFWKQLN